jgi:hypothetical protein
MRPQSALTLCLFLCVAATGARPGSRVPPRVPITRLNSWSPGRIARSTSACLTPAGRIISRARCCAAGLAQDQPPPAPGVTRTAVPPKFTNKKMEDAAKTLMGKLKGDDGKIDWASGWSKAKEGFKKGVGILEAVSGKDLNADGKVEGRGPKLTKAEQEALWKKEHEEKKSEHERRRAEYEARAAAGEDVSGGAQKPSKHGALQAKLSKEEQEVVGAIRGLLAKKFKNDQAAMFKSFDKDKTNSLDKAEIKAVCAEASVSDIRLHTIIVPTRAQTGRTKRCCCWPFPTAGVRRPMLKRVRVCWCACACRSPHDFAPRQRLAAVG